VGTGRLEAFSDGVIAIIITIMVLELKAPQGPGFDALLPVVPVFLSYVLSFVYVGIYWNNHHHMLHAAERVSGAGLWANLHLLFWLSLIPFVTAWIDENHSVAAPTALYGVVLMMAAVAYFILARILVRDNGPESELAKAFGKDTKGRISIVCYAVGIALSLWHAWLAVAIYVSVAIMWVIPDRRIEK
jgi:uncharacterized membrane protein